MGKIETFPFFSRRPIAGLTALVFAASQIVLPPMADASHLGSSTASAGSAPPPSVSATQSFQPDLFTGRATTSIPIAVPPGRKGMQPSLALAYSSSARNGWLGVGWGLDVGYIERSTKNGAPKYDASDTYTFMFQGVSSDLVQIPDGTYRAKDEGLFLRFARSGSGWEVRDKSGTRYLFGDTANSQQTTPAGIFRWCLRQVIDSNGNSLAVTYTADQGQLYLAQIDYTAHEPPTTLAPANQVLFTLEDRTDIDDNYRSGALVRTAKRLKTIEAKATVSGTLQLARRYELTYAQSRQTGRSLLTSVKQVGADGVTNLPPTTFTYQDSSAPTYSLTSNSGSSGTAAWNFRVANHDFQHDVFPCGDSHTHPYASLNWSSPVVVSSSASIDCVSESVGGNGTVSVSGCQDHYMHTWTWLYRASAGSIGLNAPGFCVWTETSGSGVSYIGRDSVSASLPAGWSVLHLTASHEHDSFSAQQTASLTSQVNAISPSQFIKPQLAGDVDGDGRTDLISFNPSGGTWAVALSQGPTFSPSTTWLSGFGNSNAIPLLGDWNADGRTDIAYYYSSDWRFALSTGSGFSADAIGPMSFGSGTPLIGDFNGDGLLDIGTFSGGTWTIALSTGSGFSPAGSFTMNYGGSGHEPLTGDFNGDGLTDIAAIEKSFGNLSVAASNGSSFVPLFTNWINGFGPDQPHTSADFNGDGLTDAAYYDKSSGQVRYALSTGTQLSAPATLPVSFSLRSSDDGLQVGDFNGDGLADPAVFNTVTGAAELSRSSGPSVDLLSQVANGVGGATDIQYQPSTQCDTICPIQGVPVLPFVIPVVNRVTASDGMGHSYTTTYVFKEGRYDAPTKEFRGFGRVEVQDVEGTVATTQFYQDDARKGRPFHTETRDQFGSLWTASDQTWSSVEPYPGVRFVTLDQTDGFIYDGDATVKQTRSRFAYDAATGNLTAAYDDGDAGVTGDERATLTAYAPNTSAWILNKPTLTQTLDAANTVVAQRRFYYDGAASTTTAPTLGNLTKEEEWLFPDPAPTPNPAGVWLATTLTYDMYGNVATVKDALNRTTTNTYDASGTYLTQIKNALNHTRQLAYDPRFGVVTTSTDQNGVTSTTEYDTLGRVTKVIGPNDTAALPTVSYEYDLSSVPTRTVVHTRVQSGQPQTLDVYAFADGLGRTIQTRSPAEDAAKQVVSGAVELNTRGLVAKQWVPYLDLASASYVSAPTADLAPPVTYAYDVLGRLLTTTDPDGSITSTSYDDWSVTGTDANSHRTRRTSDAHGRLATVEEFNGTEVYTTAYQYDALNNLTRVTDHAGNVTQIAYDSLGRKTAMDDPDMGVWTYAYDAVDNLTKQTDARGATIAFTYDALNRLTQKIATMPPPPGAVQAFQESAGQVAIEAEHYDNKIPRNGKDWVLNTSQAGYSGSGYLEALPNSGISYNTGYTTSSPELVFNVQFTTTGTYYVWVRGSGPSGSDNSVHAGLDGVGPASADRLDGFGTGWTWKRDTLDSAPATLVISTPGVHTIHLWMREDGVKVDRIILRTSSSSGAPSDTFGESPRVYSQPPAASTVTYTYDNAAKLFSKGKLTEITDPSGASGVSHDNLGRLITEQKTVDGTPYTVNRSYDVLGRLTSLTYPDGEQALYTYNLQGGIETVALQSPVSGLLSLVSDVDYNAAGQMTRIAYGNGVVTDYSYNPQTLRLSSFITQHSSFGVLQQFSYQFDAAGNVTAIQDAIHTGTQSFAYDDLNRLKTASGAYGALTYAYDPLGNLMNKEGAAMTYGLPTGKKPHAVTSTSDGLTLSYDANGNMLSKANSLSPYLSATYEYDAENRLTKVVSPQEKTITLSFSPGWNFFSLPVLPADGAIPTLFGSALGSIEQIARKTVGADTFEHYIGDSRFDDFSTLEYSTGYQLYATSAFTITVTGQAPAAGFTKSLAAGWQLLGATQAEGSLSTASWLTGLSTSQVLAYSGGSLTSTTSVDAGQSCWVQLSSAGTWRPPAGTDGTTTFVYDGDGGRVKKTTSAGTTTYLGEVYEKESSSGKATTYVFAGDQRIAAVEVSGATRTTRFYHTDHLGSSDVITDGTGAVVEHTEHLPYGAIHRREGPSGVPGPSASAFGFTGQRQEASTSLIHFPARAYDPQLGRFLQPDPFVQAPGDPQSLNRYSYVSNNPVTYVDPSGNFRINIFGFGIEFGNGRVGISIAGVTVRYDYRQQEIFLGVQFGLEIGGVGGSFEAGLFYNARYQQAGASYGASAGGFGAETRYYYDFRENQLGAGARLDTPAGAVSANTDGRRTYVDSLGREYSLKAKLKSSDGFFPRADLVEPYLGTRRVPFSGPNQFLRPATNAAIYGNQLIGVQRKLAEIQENQRILQRISVLKRVMGFLEAADPNVPSEDKILDQLSVQKRVDALQYQQFEKGFNEEAERELSIQNRLKDALERRLKSR